MWQDAVRVLFPKEPAEQISGVEAYITTADGTRLFDREATDRLGAVPGTLTPTLTISDRDRFQRIDGFGANLTGSAAHVIANLPDHGRALVSELFDPVRGIGLSYVRMTIGASDFSLGSYTYDDVAPGSADPQLSEFSVLRDAEVFSIAGSIAATSSDVRFMASPWTAPAWMKVSGKLHGGQLKRSSFVAYASYFVQYLQALHALGVTIDAISPQNEPMLDTPWYPSMLLPAANESDFVRSALGPSIVTAFPATKIFVSDHNWDSSGYASVVLGDAAASRYVRGTAFHCYAGSVADMDLTHDAFPDKDISISECSGGAWSPDFGTNLRWDMQNLIIGGTAHWAKTVMLGNLALNSADGPTNGGCADCRGVVTVDRDGNVTRNVEYYVLEHASKFVRPGAVRIGSTSTLGSDLPNVAFRNADGSTVVIAYNASARKVSLAFQASGEWQRLTLPAGAVATVRWSSVDVGRVQAIGKSRS